MHHYHVNVQWLEGRIGEMQSPELCDKISIATPPEFEGGVPGIWSPEHLFTASVVSCFMTTFLAVASFSKLDFDTFDCEATGKLDKVDGKFMMTEVELRPKLQISDESKTDRALRILQKAEANCLITNSVSAKVTLMPNVVVRKPVLQ